VRLRLLELVQAQALMQVLVLVLCHSDPMRTVGLGFPLCVSLVVGMTLGCSGSSDGNGRATGSSSGGAQSSGGASSCPAGAEACACYGNDTCDSDLSCASHLCVRLGAGGTGGIGGSRSDVSGGAMGSGASSDVSGGAMGSGASSDVSGGAMGSGASSVGGALAKGGASATGIWDGSEACPGAQPAEPMPLYVVFVYDSSNSMGDDSGNSPQWRNKASRWDPLLAAMTDFFQNSGGRGVQASLTFFPAVPGDQATICQHDYSSPNVAMTSLEAPDNQALIDALKKRVPQGGTPTLPAVTGGIKYALSLTAENPGSKAVVVLVTDGEPYPSAYTDSNGATVGCAPSGTTGLSNTIADVVSVVTAAYQGTPSVPTYVVGIGDANQANMARIAGAGGTDLVFLDTTREPAQTSAALAQALKSIRTGQLSCSMLVPETNFDPNLFNVMFKRSDGTLQGIPRSQDCSKAGWFFEPAVNPTKFTLCPSVCADVEKDAAGTLEYVQGCPNWQP
jgi:hypothetical protein